MMSKIFSKSMFHFFLLKNLLEGKQEVIVGSHTINCHLYIFGACQLIIYFGSYFDLFILGKRGFWHLGLHQSLPASSVAIIRV